MWWMKLWPALEYLHRYGSFGAWLVAMFYAFWAMGMVCVGVLWPEWFSDSARRLLWMLFGGAWLLGMFASWRALRARRDADAKRQRETLAEDTLPLAQTAFLRHEFFEAESLLRKRLERNGEDIPARLLLVSALARQGRTPEALAQLDVLEASPNLGPWRLETSRKRALLQS